MAKILIIFGSTSGNTEMVCHKVAEVLQSNNNDVVLQRVEKSDAKKDPQNYDLCILASPTYGHGVLEGNFINFREHMRKIDYNKQKFVVIGLGDFKYDEDYHLESIKILETAVTESNGQLIADPLRVTKSPLRIINTLIPKWAESISTLINT